MALATVADYIAQARVLLQDTVEPYRYSNADVVAALNMCLIEARRMRPDLFLAVSFVVPTYSSASTATAVVIDDQYRMALLYYVVGMIQLRDDEGSSDTRATVFLKTFMGQMTTPVGG